MNQVAMNFMSALFTHALQIPNDSYLVSEASKLCGPCGKIAAKTLNTKYSLTLDSLNGRLHRSSAKDAYGNPLNKPLDDSKIDFKDILYIVVEHDMYKKPAPVPPKIFKKLEKFKGPITLNMYSPILNASWIDLFRSWKTFCNICIHVEFNDEIFKLMDILLDQHQMVTFLLLAQNYGPREIDLAIKLLSQDQFCKLKVATFKPALYKKIMILWKQNKAKMEFKQISSNEFCELHKTDVNDTYGPIVRYNENWLSTYWRNRKPAVVPLVSWLNPNGTCNMTQETFFKKITETTLSFEYVKSYFVPKPKSGRGRGRPRKGAR